MSAKLENIRAEKQLLGCLLRGPSEFWPVESMLSADMFTDPLHQKIYSAIDEVCKRGTVATDVITPVSVKLDGADFGGVEIEVFLAVMRENADGDADEYIGSVIESWQARSLLDLSKWHDQQIRAGTKPLLELDEDFTDKRRAIMARGAALRPKHISDAANRVMNGSAKAFQDKGKAVGFTTGMPNLDDIMGRVLDEDLVFILGSQGEGKALALDTPIATPGGWRTMGSMRVGSTVYDERGNPTKVVATSPVMIGRPCFEVEFDDGEVIVADAEHLWVTSTRDERKKGIKEPKARTTREISESLRVEDINVANHSIPTCDPLSGDELCLPIPPYTLGAWLGDGHSAADRITTADAEVLTEIGYDGFVPEFQASQSSDVGLAKTYSIRRMGQQIQMIGGKTGSISPMSFLNDIKVAGVWKNKHIPPVYLRASYEQRLQLLRGLMDTDGTASRVGKCEFCSVNERLAGDVLELLRTMGVKCTLTQGRAMLNGRDCGPKYRIMFSTTLPIFAIKRKAGRLKKSLHPRTRTRYIVDIRPIQSVPVKCIQVENESHQYLCGRAMIPTHNSSLCAQIGMHVARSAPVLMIQMEMSDEQIAARELAHSSGLSVTKIQVGGFEFDDYDRLRTANETLVSSNFWILEADQLSLAQIESQILTMKRLHGCAAVLIDQLDKIKAQGKYRDKFERLAEVTKGLKSMAKRLKVPVVCLAQRTRGAQRRDNPTPSILDADAPSLERDADICIAVFRKYSWLMQNKPSFGPKYQEEMDKWNLERDACVNEAEIICLKRRRGKAFEQRKFTWDGAFTRFIDDRVQDVT